jgi:succinate dehydrogenase / fumarate reductase membrane anchor subunit
MRPAEAKRPYTFWWFFQRFTGLFLVIFLLAHMAVAHFKMSEFSATSLTPEGVLARYGDPFFLLFYALFLILAIPHGVNGILNLVDDYIRHDGWRTAATWITWACGLLIFVYGMLTLVV